MTYTPNTPQATQTIAFTQPLILNNFDYIDTSMKVDHAWNGNEIDSQADGSHQKISLPNQPTDITGALPTGIASIAYATGNNLFAWNGSKQVLSGISGTGTLAITTTPQSVGTIPADCIGFIVVQTQGLASNRLISLSFMNTGGPFGFAQQAVQAVGSQTQLTLSVISNQIYINRVVGSGTDYSALYKFICWPI